MHHFLPHSHNKTRAKLLSHNAFFAYIFIFMALIFSLNYLPKAFPGVLGYASNINTSDLLNGTNEIRAQHGLKPLVINQNLAAAAQRKADHMFSNNYWAHTAPDGTEPWYFILDQGYDYSYAGENLAKNFKNSSDVVDAWYKSPSHRDNLLSPNYDEIGFAVVNGVLDGYETTLVVQMFGRPRNPAYLANQPSDDAAPETAPVEVPNAEPAETSTQVPATQNNDAETPVMQPGLNQQPQTLSIPSQSRMPIIDIGFATRALAVVFGGFLFLLLAVDFWYSRKRSITKFTGHTMAHILFLTLVVVSVAFFLQPGSIR